MKATASVLAIALAAACGGAGPRPAGPAAAPASPGLAPPVLVATVDPPADPALAQLVFGGAAEMIRPQLGHAFSVRAGTGIDPAMLDDLLLVATGLTGGDVGFGRDLRSQHDLVVEVDASDPNLYGPDGRLWAAELAYRHFGSARGVITGGRIVIARDEWAQPQVILHALGHVLGLGDCPACSTACVMDGAPMHQRAYADLEREAWARMRLVPPGARRSDAPALGAKSAATLVVCRRLP